MERRPERLSRLKRRNSAVCFLISRSKVRLIASNDELVISKSMTFRSRRAFAASSFNDSIDWPVLIGSFGCGGTPSFGASAEAPASEISSGVEIGTGCVIMFSGDDGWSPPKEAKELAPEYLRVGGVRRRVSGLESKLIDRV